MNQAPIKTKSDARALELGYTYDPSKAEKVRKFLETFCVQSKHPWTGKPLKLLDWQWEEIILPLYSWFRPDGTRRFKNAIIYVPKKCGKTTLLSGLSLYHLLEFPGSECYCIASDVQQASVLYDQSADMVELSPHLKDRLWVRRNIKAILDEKRKSKFRVLSSTPEGKSGFSANLVCYDEIAEWNGTHARTIYDRLVNAGMARVNSLQLVISTAQYDRAHLGFELYNRAQQIKKGSVIELDTLPVIYSLGEEEDWQVENNWWKVCPSIDITVPKQYYRDEYQRVKNNPRDEAQFRTFLLCQWVGHAEQWLSSIDWNACYEDFNEEDLYGLPAFVGLDGSSKGDLFAYTIIIPKDGKYYLIPRAFSPRDLANKKEETDHVPYREWEREGHITLTSGNVIDPSAVLKSLKADSEKFDFVDVRFDPNGLELFRQAAEEEDLFLVEAAQTASVMAPPTSFLERLVKERKIRHNGHPVLSWCIGNCTVKTDSQDRIMIDKRRVTGRIDLATSTILALLGVMGDEGSTDDDPLCFLLS